MTAEPQRDQDATASEPADEQVNEEAAVTEPSPPETAATEASPSVENESPEAVAPPAVVESTVEGPPATAPVAATAADPAAPDMKSRRLAAIAAGRRVAAFLIAVALFLAGLRIGYVLHEMNRPVATVSSLEGPGSVQPPPIAQEFIAALASNDADALRSALDSQQHQDLTGEMTRFGIHRISQVETLGTEVDGNRSATEILMKAENADGMPFAINLVILVDNGKIEGFR